MNEQYPPVLTSKTFVQETAIELWEMLPTVLLSGFLFTLISLPALVIILMNMTGLAILVGIVTIGPGWISMSSLIARALLHESATIVDFFKAFASFYMRGVLLGTLFALPLISAAWLLPSLLIPPIPTLIWVGLAADVSGVFLLSALSLYTYPQIVLYNLGAMTALKNSLLLAARYLSDTIGLLAMAVLFALLSIKVSYFLLMVLPACWLVFVINHCRMVISIEIGQIAHPSSHQGPE
ncbi:MAG: hypothetical protein PHQ40_12010 [Anaerolineaceae bacterium]|nr:hypothetical protein [Anaerolineaceae bacterium]